METILAATKQSVGGEVKYLVAFFNFQRKPFPPPHLLPINTRRGEARRVRLTRATRLRGEVTSLGRRRLHFSAVHV
jgi:hypothetical protein